MGENGSINNKRQKIEPIDGHSNVYIGKQRAINNVIDSMVIGDEGNEIYDKIKKGLDSKNSESIRKLSYRFNKQLLNHLKDFRN